jgi:ribosome-binding protein aMBF1 (putative translation factor)
MPQIKLADMDDLKKNVFEKSPEVKDEYNKMKFVRKLQRELMKARIDKGLSQKELAELVDTTQTKIPALLYEFL